jgi:hypothetical protein
MKFNQALNNFSAGEWSPKMKGRTDVQQYQNACETLINFTPQIQGGVFRRPPTTIYTLDSANNTNLQDAISTPGVVRSKFIPRVLSDGTKQMMVALNTLPSTHWFVLSGRGDGTTPDVPTFQAAASMYTSPSDFTVDAASIKYAQVGDIVFMVQNATDAGKAPRVWYAGANSGGYVRRYDYYGVSTAYAYANGNYLATPYLPPNANYSSVVLNRASLGAKVAGDYTLLISSAAFFTPQHVGAFFKLSVGGVTGVVQISAYGSSTSVDAQAMTELPPSGLYGGAVAGSSWEESAWSDYRGWPRSIIPYQGRLIFGGTKSYPDTIWGTRIGNVFDLMERPFEQDDAFEGYENDNSRPFTLSPNTASASNIRALSAAKTLLVHTDKGEIVAYGTNGALGPNDVVFESSTSFGANSPMPTRTNSYSVFVEKGGRKLRDVSFNWEENQYKSSDMSFTSDHLTIDEDDSGSGADAIIEIQGVSLNGNFVLAKTENGKLYSLSLDREYQINAWSRFELGGSSQYSDLPIVKSIGAIEYLSGDNVFFITERRINGSNVAQIEVMKAPCELNTVHDGATLGDIGQFYVDLKVAKSNGGASTITGATHVAGETVSVFADGKYVGDKVVSVSGVITLDHAASFVIYGLPYTSTLKTMPIEIGNQIPGSPQGLMKRVDEVTIRFWNSYGAKYGYKESDMISIGFRDPNAIEADDIELFTGMKAIKMASNYTPEAQIIITQDKPWPCNVLAVIAKGQTYD